MLQVSNQLRQLNLCFITKVMEGEILYDERGMTTDEVVVLPFLESLSLGITTQDTSVPTELISRLSLPTLKQVRLFDPCGTEEAYPLNHESLGGLAAFFRSLGNLMMSSPLVEIIVEGRWVETCLLSELVKYLDLRRLRII